MKPKTFAAKLFGALAAVAVLALSGSTGAGPAYADKPIVDPNTPLPPGGPRNQNLSGGAGGPTKLAAHIHLGGDAVAQHTGKGGSEKILKIGQGDAFPSPGISV